MERYTAKELEVLPTLCTGQCCDLKVDTGSLRVWLCRCGKEDGALDDNEVTVEVYNPKVFRWETIDKYPG